GASLEVDDADPDVAAQLPQDLAAGAAGGRRPRRVRHHRDRVEAADALGDRLEHGHALRAQREAVSRALDVSAGDDRAVPAAQGGAHVEAGGGGVGARPRAPGQPRQGPQVGWLGAHGRRATSRMMRLSTSISPAFTRSPTSRTSLWSSFFLRTPAAMFVMQDRPRTRRPMWRAATTSGTGDMPPAAAPTPRAMRISAGVS